MKLIKYHIIAFVFLCILSHGVQGQNLRINEICPDNASVLVDEDGTYSDLIELYNDSDDLINLNNFFLSDDFDDPFKWQFPNVSIEPKEYLVLIADGEDFYDQYLHTSFKLSKSGEELILSDDNLTEIHRIEFPTISENLSFSYVNQQWIITQPSFGEPNSSEAVPILTPPNFSHSSGMYDDILILELSQPEEANIFFTLNGDKPNPDGQSYESPILIEQTMTVCAMSTKLGFLDSDYTCSTFIIGEKHSIPILSITTDSSLLFDEEDGLFRLGLDAEEDWPFYGANFWSDKEIEVYFEYFENNSPVYNGNYGLQMHGGRESRTAPQKSFRLLAKEKYSSPYFEYPFFLDKPEIRKFKRLVVRNASGDFNEAHLRDGFVQRHIARNDIDVDLNAYEPIVVYINGVYYGVMGLREKVDKHYINTNFGLESDQIDLLEENILVIEGDSLTFLDDYTFITNADLSIDSNLELAKDRFDVESFTDYFIIQLGLNSTAWPNNNIKYWREKGSDSQWRYLLFDMDVALGRHPWTDYDIDAFGLKMMLTDNVHIDLFKSFLTNKSYRDFFLNRHQDIFNTVFEKNYFNSSLVELVDLIRPEMDDHFDLWSEHGYDEWESERIQKMKDYIINRPLYSRMYLANYFDIQSDYKLSIENNGNGNVKLNTLDLLDGSFSGYYFCDIPISLQAESITSHYFSHWEIETNGQVYHDHNQVLNISLCKDALIRPVWKEISDTEIIDIYFDQDSRSIWLKNIESNISDLSVQIYNAAGQLTYFEKLDGLTSSKQISLREVYPGIYFIQILSSNELLSHKKIVML